ncbi:hypothetical protein DEO72_LG3g2013 [Vigna unguiculata]|uniref:Uncharacterized protein n=1 Tax=Vigna unguiculata TaxID=3917 RepID=A0A4D6LFX1_VIGUN|nr:hypothetical protein DEO72_LG3g2013 [Vigna unguiculata]
MLITLYFRRGNASYEEEKLEEEVYEFQELEIHGGNDHEIYESERAIEHTDLQSTSIICIFNLSACILRRTAISGTSIASVD